MVSDVLQIFWRGEMVIPHWNLYRQLRRRRDKVTAQLLGHELDNRGKICHFKDFYFSQNDKD
jgi:hypothetical protein